jgi:hypothetical protein
MRTFALAGLIAIIGVVLLIEGFTQKNDGGLAAIGVLLLIVAGLLEDALEHPRLTKRSLAHRARPAGILGARGHYGLGTAIPQSSSMTKARFSERASRSVRLLRKLCRSVKYMSRSASITSSTGGRSPFLSFDTARPSLSPCRIAGGAVDQSI